MKWLESRILWGGLLIVGGVLFLLQNLGILPLGSLFWGALIGFGGLFFLSLFLQNRLNWWALIPGMTLLSIAVLISLDVFAPRIAGRFGGAIVLGGIGLAFGLINLFDRRQWWAIIPFGVLASLAAMVGLESFFPGMQTPGLFFLGLGLTFALVAVQSGAQREMRWAWIPAGIMLVMGVIFMAAGGNMLGLLWPLALIAAGVFLVARAFFRRDDR